MTILSFGGGAHLGQMPVAETQSELSLRESGATSSHHSSAQEFSFLASMNATDRGDPPDHGDDGDDCAHVKWMMITLEAPGSARG